MIVIAIGSPQESVASLNGPGGLANLATGQCRVAVDPHSPEPGATAALQPTEAAQSFRAITGVSESPTVIAVAGGLVRCIGIGDLDEGFSHRCRLALLDRSGSTPLVHRGRGAKSVLLRDRQD